MSFNFLSDEQKSIKEIARKVAQEQIAKGASERDLKGEFPWDVVKIFKDIGFFGCDFKEKYGGSQLGLLAFSLIIEEIAKVCSSSAVVLLVHELGSLPILLAGSKKQKNRWLPFLATGEKLISFALTEPNAGSDVAGITTTAVRKGDKYILNGRKQFISHADVADYICVACKTNFKNKREISIIVVEKGSSGFFIGKKEEKMGMRASSTCELIFEDCEVSVDNLLGKEGDGFSILMKTLDFTRPCVGAQAVGIAQGSLDYATQYAKNRYQFGVPIIKNQGLAWMLAEMDMAVESARQLVYKASSIFEVLKKDLSKVPLDAIRLSAMSKLLASENAMKVTTDAVQILGGYGYIKEYPLERMMRDAKVCQIYEGTSQIQKTVISSCL